MGLFIQSHPGAFLKSNAAFKRYYQLTKPGIIYGNLLTAAAGFLLAAKHDVHIGLLLETLLGIGLVIASACVFNNYIDRGIDKKMARTKQRALVLGTISGRNALAYAAVLGGLGFGLLAFYTNPLTVLVGAIGYVDYVVVYGIGKRVSSLSTIIGSIAGATPPVAGYVAVTNHFDSAALVLFLLLTFWQMPHFYAIALYRYGDYAATGLPILPVKKGRRVTKYQILFFTVLFIISALMLTLLAYTGNVYFVITATLGIYWLLLGIQGLGSHTERTDAVWARHMFLFSLIVITVLSLLLATSAHLP